VEGIAKNLAPKKPLSVSARKPDGTVKRFEAIARADTPVEVDYYRHGGILPAVLRQICRTSRTK